VSAGSRTNRLTTQTLDYHRRCSHTRRLLLQCLFQSSELPLPCSDIFVDYNSHNRNMFTAINTDKSENRIANATDARPLVLGHFGTNGNPTEIAFRIQSQTYVPTCII